MTDLGFNLQSIGYGIAAVVYLILAILVLLNLRGTLHGKLITVAVVATFTWAALLALAEHAQDLTLLQTLLLEFLHDAVWIVLLSTLLGSAVGAGRNWLIRYGGVLLVAGLLVTGVGREIYSINNNGADGAGNILVLGSILTALFVLIAIEQIYRNARESQRGGLKYLCLGVGVIFAFDLFLYSNAILAGQISPIFWAARGFIVALCAPLIAVAVQRTSSWSVGIFVSRQIVFYTATLLAAGMYLVAVGFAGYYIRRGGGEWGSLAQVVFFAAAMIALGVFLFSDISRAKLRVFISKHFYQNKYDYREEWLRLIGTLTSVEEKLPLKKRAIKVLAQVLDAPSGILWMRSYDSSVLSAAAGWNINSPDGELTPDSALVEFMTRTGWVIDLNEFERDRSHYDDIEINGEILQTPDAAFIIPLINDSSLIGFVVLTAPRSPIRLNFEDRDLLKTAGCQVASYLAQEAATEQLAESRQFEAFNKLTAYLMHDLKNVIAQQSLLVENARKHKDKPEFIDDAVETIRGSVVRMRRVIEHLQQNSLPQGRERVELGKLILQAVSQCGDRAPEPRASLEETRVWVHADPERLLMAVSHAIRNAQDATPSDGEISVSLASDGEKCTVEVRDNGSGMDEAFVRDRLFRPFQSTKGIEGMGIGAYQIRETVRSLGGEVHVYSRPGVGTSLVLELSVESPV